MSSPEWNCSDCTYGPMPCSVKICELCQNPQKTGDCPNPDPSGLPRHPPPPKVNVSKGIAVGRRPHTARKSGGSRHHKRNNKSTKYKRKHK